MEADKKISKAANEVAQNEHLNKVIQDEIANSSNKPIDPYEKAKEENLKRLNQCLRTLDSLIHRNRN